MSPTKTMDNNDSEAFEDSLGSLNIPIIYIIIGISCICLCCCIIIAIILYRRHKINKSNTSNTDKIIDEGDQTKFKKVDKETTETRDIDHNHNNFAQMDSDNENNTTHTTIEMVNGVEHEFGWKYSIKGQRVDQSSYRSSLATNAKAPLAAVDADDDTVFDRIINDRKTTVSHNPLRNSISQSHSKISAFHNGSIASPIPATGPHPSHRSSQPFQNQQKSRHSQSNVPSMTSRNSHHNQQPNHPKLSLKARNSHSQSHNAFHNPIQNPRQSRHSHSNVPSMTAPTSPQSVQSHQSYQSHPNHPNLKPRNSHSHSHNVFHSPSPNPHGLQNHPSSNPRNSYATYNTSPMIHGADYLEEEDIESSADSNSDDTKIQHSENSQNSNNSKSVTRQTQATKPVVVDTLTSIVNAYKEREASRSKNWEHSPAPLQNAYHD